jgi:hypothetical protein
MVKQRKVKLLRHFRIIRPLLQRHPSAVDRMGNKNNPLKQSKPSSIFLILVSTFICVYSQQWCAPEHIKPMEVYAGCLTDKRDYRISDRHKSKNNDTKYFMTFPYSQSSISDNIRTVMTINLCEQFMETMHITSSSIFDTPRQTGN